MNELDFDVGFTDIDDEEEDATPQKHDNAQQGYNEDIHISAYFPNNFFAPITKRDVDAIQDGGFDSYTEFEEDERKSIHEEDISCTLDIPEADEALEKKKTNVKKIIIGIREWVVELIREGAVIAEKTGSDKKAAREYTKKAEMPKITFAAPVKKMSFVKKLIIFLIACVGLGVFFGVKANSYFWFKDGKANAMACAWSWLMEEKLPIIMSPVQSDVFLTGFSMGFGILGIIGLFIWLDSDAKKRSRVGHEHGNARLGTNRDFKTYKRKFMD